MSGRGVQTAALSCLVVFTVLSSDNWLASVGISKARLEGFGPEVPGGFQNLC